jgi:hypothetical protein
MSDFDLARPFNAWIDGRRVAALRRRRYIRANNNSGGSGEDWDLTIRTLVLGHKVKTRVPVVL